ncbi:MAG: hypothetical protein E7507_03360 [Ruminococcus sp.]|nr:hypothetical protein [Ruminococcus sp.]
MKYTVKTFKPHEIVLPILHPAGKVPIRPVLPAEERAKRYLEVIPEIEKEADMFSKKLAEAEPFKEVTGKIFIKHYDYEDEYLPQTEIWFSKEHYSLLDSPRDIFFYMQDIVTDFYEDLLCDMYKNNEDPNSPEFIAFLTEVTREYERALRMEAENIKKFGYDYYLEYCKIYKLTY